MGCTTSRPLEDAPRAPPRPPVAKSAEAGAEGPSGEEGGGDADGEKRPEYGEVIHHGSSIATLPIDGVTYNLNFDHFSYPHTDKPEEPETPEEIPGPPPLVQVADVERLQRFVARTAFGAAYGEALAQAILWPGPGVPNLEGGWVRLMAAENGNVATDAAFLVNGEVRTPFELHPKTEKQHELFTALYKPWLKIVLGGQVGADCPGDMVIWFTPSLKLNITHADWKPHDNSYQGNGLRKVWVEHLRAELAKQRQGQTGPPAIPSLRGASLVKDLTVREGKLDEVTGSFVERFAQVMSMMMGDVMDWPPTRGRVSRVQVYLVHLEGEGTSAFVNIIDAAGNHIEQTSTTARCLDPSLLQDAIGAQWAQVCSDGAPDFNTHPSFVSFSGSPTGSDTTQLQTSMVWFSSDLSAEQRDIVSDVYSLRPGDRPSSVLVVPSAAPGGRPPATSAEANLRLGVVARPMETVFMDVFGLTLSHMMNIAFSWPPAGYVGKAIIILGHAPGQGPTAHVGYTTVEGNSIQCGPSREGHPPGVLHNSVAELWSDFCGNRTPGVDHPILVTISATLVPGTSVAQGAPQAGTQADFSVMMVGREEELTNEDAVTLGLLYVFRPGGHTPDPRSSPTARPTSGPVKAAGANRTSWTVGGG